MKQRRKSYVRGQDRNGNPARRWLEFDVVCDQVRRRKALFIARLQRRLVEKDGCLLDIGTVDHGGYPRISFRYKAKGQKGRAGLVSMQTMRVYAILKNCAPIPPGFEAGHHFECPNRACIFHIDLQHYRENASLGWLNGARQRAAAKELSDDDIPF